MVLGKSDNKDIFVQFERIFIHNMKSISEEMVGHKNEKNSYDNIFHNLQT